MMNRIDALKRGVKRLLKKSSNDEDKNASFALKTNEERKCIRWTIQNIHACPLVKGEYLESPPFSSGYLNNTKWTLRLYPKGRNSTFLETVGLFLNKISSSATCSVNYEFKLLDLCTIDGYFINQSAFEDLEECGTDEFLSSENLSSAPFLKIECTMQITYFGEYQIGEEGFPNCTCALSEDLRNLYHQEKQSDAILKVGKINIPVHKAILGARSKVFSDMLKGDKKSRSTRDIITIEHLAGPVEESVMRNLIEYIYTGTVDNFTVSKAISLYPVAKEYSLKELKQLCIDKILVTISVENFCCIAALADKYQAAKMKLATKNFFCKYSAQIMDTEDWKNFIREQRTMASEMMDALASEIKAKCSSIEPNDR